MGPVMQRFFRIADEALYEDVRLALDVSWGHVPPTTCVDPATTAPRDLQGRILLAVRNEFADFEAVSAILPGLLESGAVEEITASAYWAAMPQTEGP